MRRAVVVTVSPLGLLGPASALADGGPVPPAQGGAGVAAPGSAYSFIALGAGRNTLVERVRRVGATVEEYTLLRGAFGVPGATYDGSGTGLSADGRTLVLADIGDTTYPPTRTRLLVLDTGRLRARARIELSGYFTVDAISPTGRWLYLIHYTSPSSGNSYEVRAFDLTRRRLLRKPVVDPREPDEKMQGLPLTRTTSADGRWVYTLYYRGNEAPFIHALDTAARAAFCVDLPVPIEPDLSSIRLVLASAKTLRIDRGDTPLALMDTRTFAISRADVARPAGDGFAVPNRSQGGPPWALAFVPLVALIALALVARRRRRSLATGPRSPTDADGPADDRPTPA
jgi:hypothetical protein